MIYDSLYAAAPAHILWPSRPGRLVQRIGEFIASGHVLDAGCGDGKNALSLELAGYDVTGFDNSAIALEGLRNRFAATDRVPRGDYIVASAEDWADRTRYDVVISYGLYHCLPRATRIVLQRRLFRYLRKGGFVLFTSLVNLLPIPTGHGTADFELADVSEISAIFDNFTIVEHETGTFEEEHRPIIGRHRHAAVWIVARR